MELIERDLDLEKELEKLKGSFKHDDEITNIYNVQTKKIKYIFHIFLLEIIELLFISL